MMKTKIVYNDISKAKSIYDHFVDEDLFQKVYTYGHRHFKRDSFYHYSNPIKSKGLVEIGTYGTQFLAAGLFLIGLSVMVENMIHMITG